MGLRTTKTTWVYPPRDSFTGQSLADDHYRRFVLDLHDRGFEIALHNVGSGHFTREEILAGLDRYRDILGEYPRININHASNPDNLYLGGERFVPPLRWLYRLYWRLKRRRPCRGEDPRSDVFWGDFVKQHIRYIRGLTFGDIDLRRRDPLVSYRMPGTEPWSNLWFERLRRAYRARIHRFASAGCPRPA